MKVTFAGAADTVTGSCHLVELGGTRILLDCGMFQGRKAFRDRNSAPFPFDPKSVDLVLLSHAHLDHTGRLPYLVKSGFKGKIICTAATRDLARVILLDSAHIQESDAKRARRKGYGSPVPLYTSEDVFETLDRFVRPIDYEDAVDIGSNISATFRDAGHVLGSAFIEIADSSGGAVRRLTFSGDLGNLNKPLVRDPFDRVAPADLILLESTYGSRSHRPFEESVKELRAVVVETFSRNGVVVIPAFALERSQELLYVLFGMYEDGLLGDASVFLDSPMAIEVTRIFTRHPSAFDADALKLAQRGKNPFAFKNLHFTHSAAASRAINAVKGPAIIVSASGMCTGGRIVHHLRHRLSEPRNSILFIGYQADGTLGREIVNGAESVTIHRRDIPVNANVHTIGGFSGHAGQDTLLSWLGSADLPGRVELVHGEETAIEAMAGAIATRFGTATHNPKYGETVSV